MNNNNQHHVMDNWGQSIINDFLEDGGFRRRECKQTAHQKFQQLISTDYDPDDGWDQRCNALAVWAIICVELEVPSPELELLCISIVSAMEKLPNGEHPLWLGQLAFDLVLFKFDDSPSALDLTETAKSLFSTIKLAAKNFQEEPGNKGLDFYKVGKLNPDDFGHLLGVENRQDIRQLFNTQELLKQLGKNGVNEALYLLVILNMGDGKNQERWLGQAVDGAWPTKQLAAYYLGYLLLPTNEQKGKVFLKKVTFPSEDDPNYGVLSDLALKAKVKSYRGDWAKERREERYNLWRTEAEHVAAQWETVERCVIGVQDLVGLAEWKQAESIELPDHIRSLTLETGRLVEAMFKWCLSKWPIDSSKLPITRSIKDWQLSDFEPNIGPILGNGEDGHSLGIEMLLKLADLKLDPKLRDLGYIDGKIWSVWNLCTNLSTLVVANAVAARCHDRHPFRHTPKDSLVATLGILNAAYFVRNSNAHYSDPDKMTSADEAVFWGSAVRSTVDQFMANCVRLLDKEVVS